MPRDRMPAGSRGELAPLAIRHGRRLRCEELESRQAPGVMLAWPSAGLGFENPTEDLGGLARQSSESGTLAPVVEKVGSGQQSEPPSIDSLDSEALLLAAEPSRVSSPSSAVENASLQQPQANRSNDPLDAALLGLYGVDADAGLSINLLEQVFADQQDASHEEPPQEEGASDEDLLKNQPRDRPSALPPTPSGGGGSAGASNGSGSGSGSGASRFPNSSQGSASPPSTAAAISPASAQAAEGEAVAEASAAAATTHAAVDCDSGDPSFPGDYNNDNAVSTPDFDVFQQSFGSTTELATDGNNDRVVNAADYTIWRDSIGAERVCAPGDFSITGPTEVASTETFTVTWEAAEPATSYEVTLFEVNDGSAPPVITEVVTGTSAEFTLLSSGFRFVSVTAINEFGSTESSNQNFQVMQDIPVPTQTLFITSTPFFVDVIDVVPPFVGFFGSVEAADFHCTDFADQAGLLDEPWDRQTIFYRAALLTNFADLPSRSAISDSAIVNTDGDLVFNGLSDFFAGSFANPILDENGTVPAAGTKAWTGSNADGTPSGFNANGWSDLNAQATFGVVDAGANWIESGVQAAFDPNTHLYCIGDTPSGDEG